METRYNHLTVEAELARYWIDNTIYQPKANANSFSIDTPPPTVSGSLHLGHIFSYTQTDIIARYKRMSGFNVYYPFGFDDNGLATERFVEKQCNVRAHQMSRHDFIKLCLEQTALAEEEFKKLWQQMGLSIDWHYAYSTIAPETRAISQASFIDLFNKGFIYRAHEPVLYCGSCQTAIAQAELDDKEVPSVFYEVKFKDAQGANLIIATTRPELIYSCVALLYHPSDKRYQKLRGTQALVPLAGHLVPLLEDENVIPDKGTGLVMCCTFGDKTDIEWYKKFKLPYRPSLGKDGRFVQEHPCAGMNIADGRKTIVEQLRQVDYIVTEKPITHAVNIHERCKKEIEFLILPQWFIKILPYKNELIKLAENIHWYPAFMKTRYINWVENINWDWCISRQRRFGIPFPVWHCTECQNILLAGFDTLPVDPQETPYQGRCSHCESTKIVPDTDVMDTWNTSALTPQIVMKLLHPSANFFDATKTLTPFVPISMRPQAHDIIRTWAFYTIARSWMHHKDIPWKSIVISGHVLSSQQEKLSKSQENSTTSPQHLLKTYPADAIRYWTASGGLGHDIAFSDAQIRIGQRLVTKLWNAFRFSKNHLANFGYNPQQPTELGLVNEWVLTELTNCFEQYKRSFDDYEFGHALPPLEQFFWNKFCDNYLELIKHQVFNQTEYPTSQVHATLWTLYQVGLAILQLYAPYLPYVTEAIYQDIYKKDIGVNSIHLTQFASTIKSASFESSVLMHQIINIVTQVRKLKSENKLSLNTPVSTLNIVCDNQDMALQIPAHEQLIKGVTHAQEIWCTFSTSINSGLITDGDKVQITVMVAQDSKRD